MAGKDDDIVLQISTDQSQIKRQLRELGQDITVATNGYSKAFAKAGADMDKSFNTTAMQRRINDMVGISTKASKQWTGVLSEQGKELDRLRAKYNPIFSTIKQYQAQVVEIQQAHRLGAITADEMAAAIQRERQATLASVAAIKQRNAAIAGGTRHSANVGAFNTANIAAQFQDIGVTTAMGMNPLQIALQQGTQLSAVLDQLKHSGQSTGQALVGAFTSLISPVSLVTIGLIAGGAALAQYFAGAGEKTKTVDDALTEHAKTIKDLQKAYGLAADGAEDYARRSTAAIEAAERRATAALRRAVAEQEKQAQSLLSDNGGFSGFGLAKRFGLLGDTDLSAVNLKFAAFAEPIKKLREEIKSGKPDYDAFQRALDAIAATDPGRLGPLRDELSGIIDKAAEGREALDGMKEALGGLTQAQVDTARIIAQINGIEEAAKAANEATGALKKMLEGMGSGLDGNADSKGGSVGGPGAMDRAQEEFRKRMELWRRFGYDNDSKLDPNKPKVEKQQRTPRTASDRFFEDIEAIKARTQALAEETAMVGQSYEAQEKRKVAFDLEQKALKEVREEARRKGDQDWKNKQLSADQVKAIDEVSTAYAKQAEELRLAQKAQDDLNDRAQFFGDLTVGVLDDITSGADGLEKALKRVTAALAEAVIKAVLLGQGPLASIFGTQPSNGYSVGGLVGSIFNKQGLPSSGSSGAANVVTNAVSSGVTKALGGGGAASGAAYSVGNATNFIKQYAAAIGIDPSTALKVAKSEGLGAGIWQSNYMKGGFREPSFGPFQLLKGGKGTGFGTGLGNAFQAQTGLDPSDPANWQQSTAFALNHAKQNGWGAWFGAKGRGITGFDGIDRSAKTASVAISKLTAGTTTAAKGLGDLGAGMGKFGNALNQFPSAPSSGGGGGSWLSSLFGGGGLNSAFSGTKAFNWLSANPGGYIGLFADGTDYAPGGMAIVGEEGPELINLPRGSKVFPADATRSMLNGSRIRGGQTGRRGGGGGGGYSGGSQDVVRVVLQDDSGRMAGIADQRIQTHSGTIVQVAVQQSTKTVRGQLPGMIADTQARSM